MLSRSVLLLAALGCACQRPTTATPTHDAAPPALVVSAERDAGAAPPAEVAVEIPRSAGTTPRLVRTSASACGGMLAAGANAAEAMVEALFMRSHVAYAHDGTLAVSGTISYAEVAPTITVPGCAGGFGGSDVPSNSVYETSDLMPADAAAWTKAAKGRAFGVLGAHAYSRVLSTVSDPSWSAGASEIRVLWVELAHRDDDLGASSGILGIVGRYGDALKVLASAGGQIARPAATIPIETLSGSGTFWVLLPYPDSGLPGPDDDEAWMRDIEKGQWRVAYVWKNGALREAGVVPVAMQPNAERAKSWGAQLVSARYEATDTGLVGHEIWRTTSGAERRMDRSYVLSAAELAKKYSSKILRPTSYAPPKS